MNTTHTLGAIRAAEIITGERYGEHNYKKLFTTLYGNKTVEGIADIINNETAAFDMLRALQTALELLKASEHDMREKNDTLAAQIILDAREKVEVAISKADKGE